jgi:NitT/TauT family transport system substrate-binding protein
MWHWKLPETAMTLKDGMGAKRGEALRIPVSTSLHIFGCFALATAYLTSGAAAADRVSVGLGGSTVDAAFYLAKDKGYFQEENIDANLIVFSSGANQIAPLGTGELEVGSGAASVGLYNAIGRGVGLRIVADKGHTEPGYAYQNVIISKPLIDSGEFKSLKDLKGKRIGIAAEGVSTLSYLNEATKAGGIDYKDVTPIYLPMPQHLAAMKNGVIDGSILPEPPGTLIVEAGVGVRFMNTEEFYPYGQVTMVFYGEKFLKERRELAQRFMRAYLRGIRTYNDALKDGKLQGDTATDVIAIMNNNFKIDRAMIARMYAPAIDPNGAVQVASLQKDLDFFRSQGWVTRPVDLNNVIDLSVVQRASAELGRYDRKRN